jgi:signal transduction histidine kinase/signal recognition particle receptor subunit beta
VAQWNHSEKLLYAKLVYYGPAFGGKTTNLETLHRLTDPAGEQRLLSLKTSRDRTLFFDLLPFDLGSILGYRVAMKLYTVPGQVRYEKTRQTVLTGADAVVFVADSSNDREEQNRWSLQNLRMNMRTVGLDLKTPVLYQFNKQDKQEAAEPSRVAGWLNVDPAAGVPAIATVGRGVLETFVSAGKAMLSKIYEQADVRTRAGIDPLELSRQIESTFAPYVVRAKDRDADAQAQTHTDEIVLSGDDLLSDSVRTQTELGEQLGEARACLRRQHRELDALRRMSESLIKVGPCLEPERLLDAALETAVEILEAPVVSLIRSAPGKPLVVERCRGRDEDPLGASVEGRAILERMIASGPSSVVDDLRDELDTPAVSAMPGLKAAACVSTGDSSQRYLVAYAVLPDGAFKVEDLRFLGTLGAHLEVGLEQTRLHRQVADHRDELERKVEQRTTALRRAYEELREKEQTKDRLLNNLSHEMGSPLTAIVAASTFIRDYRSNAGQRAELTQSMLDSAGKLQHYLDQLLRLADLAETSRPTLGTTTGAELLEAAVSLCGSERIEVQVANPAETLSLDLALVSRAVSNLLDNAIKFSPNDAPVELELRREDNGVAIVVSDRGKGVEESDRERIFAPFEQGGMSLTDKPVGVGMGLYEARVIAKQHGGSLEYENRNAGGSRFVLRLPDAWVDLKDRNREVVHA